MYPFVLEILNNLMTRVSIHGHKLQHWPGAIDCHVTQSHSTSHESVESGQHQPSLPLTALLRTPTSSFTMTYYITGNLYKIFNISNSVGLQSEKSQAKGLQILICLVNESTSLS